ncbi:MAG: putative hydro-lyase [Planctomycetota bacterium]|nr:MAG: putative hydro-lyase [Planctomycetota bacterium]
MQHDRRRFVRGIALSGLHRSPACFAISYFRAFVIDIRTVSSFSRTQEKVFASPGELRAAVRAGRFAGQTAGQCPGYVQTNVVILPAEYADEFAEFCGANDRPCPLVAMTSPGDPRLPDVAADADLRTDVPRYRVFRGGAADRVEPTDIRGLWRDDFVGFLLGCSFTFEAALVAAGLRVRHIDEGRNVPMYRTNRPCRSAGRFAGPLVVSMRPYRRDQINEVVRITGEFPRMHGAPVHVGDPAAIGIADITKPDFGDAVTIHEDELPVFWACGVTPQLALVAAKPEIAITHSPGHMFVTELRDEAFREVVHIAS